MAVPILLSGSFNPVNDAQPIFLQPSWDEPNGILQALQGSLKKMKDMYEPPKNMVPKNPCASDLARTGCKDAQCLKRYTESLSGSCAALLLRPVKPALPEPSPEPVEKLDVLSKLLGQMERGSRVSEKVEDRRRVEQQRPTGFFTMQTTDADGNSEVVSGPIGAKSTPTLPPELAQLVQMMPDLTSQVFPDLAQMFGMPSLAPRERSAPQPKEPRYPTASIGDDPAEVAAAKRYKDHPCGEEIMQCREVAGPVMADVKQCLLAHLEQLSPRCKCFMTQAEGPEKIQPKLAPSAKAAAAPTVHVVSATPVPPTAARVVVLEDATIAPHALLMGASPPHLPRHGAHGGSCLIMMGATLVLFLLVLRKCLLCCFRAATPPTMAIVVPPEQTEIKLVEPLRVEDIKTVVTAK